MTSVSVAVRMSVGGASCQIIQRGVLGPPVSRAELELVGALTVLLSVFLHGLTAQPLAGRYAATHRPELEPVEHPEPTLRRLVSPSRKRS
jgi:NhaP-type Na+/H+ or K+/H+ antiporter